MRSNIQSCFPELAFGTSGVRALVESFSFEAVSAYVFSFVERMRQTGALAGEAKIAVGIDLRPSSPKIALMVCETLAHLGLRPEYLGQLPTPALALHCLASGIPGIMITGSHIPFDRNGIKFYRPDGEILKDDEQAIAQASIPGGVLPVQAHWSALPQISLQARTMYVRRYTDYFGADALAGLRVGVYEHSAVGRDLTQEVLRGVGAEVISLGRSEEFIPVDTEAVSEADLAQARRWCEENRLDALVSTDGDGDRPLVFDAQGNFVRGDILGLLCAHTIGVEALAVPVSCNTAIEKTGFFKRVIRTRIGSPYVIAGMNDLLAADAAMIAGFEANGGFLLGSGVKNLSALPTRDALLPMISILAAANRRKQSVASLVAELPQRFTYSDRLKDVPTAFSQSLLARLVDDPGLQKEIFPEGVAIVSIDKIDGVRMSFADGRIAHLRASGNAPELRCYAEASTLEQAKALCEQTLRSVVRS